MKSLSPLKLAYLLVGLLLAIGLAGAVPSAAQTSNSAHATPASAQQIGGDGTCRLFLPLIQGPARPSSIAATEMGWETGGGGQVTFIVRRNGQAYDMHVTSYHFSPRDDRFTIVPGSGAVYQAIAAVMQDQGTIRLHAPDEPPRGTWTTLQFSDGERTSTFKDVVVEGDLKTIYDHVVGQIRP